MSDAKENPRCLVHYHMIPDGQCSCPHECEDCGCHYAGEHSKDDCITVLKSRLKIAEIGEKIKALEAERPPASRDELVAAAKSDLQQLLKNMRPATEEELREQGQNMGKNYKPGPRQAVPFPPVPDSCEGGDPCWYNQETGYTEHCPKHDAIMADRAMDVDTRRRSRKAAEELLSFLDIGFPKGQRYFNSLKETIAICIEQNMKGIHRL
jgi:hypothetical protein